MVSPTERANSYAKKLKTKLRTLWDILRIHIFEVNSRVIPDTTDDW